MDAPEISSPKCDPQPFSQEATDYLNNAIQGRKVKLETTEKDKYNRDLGTIYLDGLDVNRSIVEHGYAEVYRGDEAYQQHPYYSAELKAKSQKIGMWSLEDYESPRAYRARCR
jgi:endonuclease YncB( thermonuclease family)